MEREMVDMITATRAFEANVTVLSNYKNIAQRAMQIGR
jgi:flagellar basal body rod protein FlgC